MRPWVLAYYFVTVGSEVFKYNHHCLELNIFQAMSKNIIIRLEP